MSEVELDELGFEIACRIIKDELHRIDDLELFARVQKYLNCYSHVRVPMLEVISSVGLGCSHFGGVEV